MDKLDWALLVAQAVCWIEYLAPLVICAMTNEISFATILYIYVFLIFPCWIAYELMNFRLKELKELRIKKFWATIAVILVPFSIVLYLASIIFYIWLALYL
jgi:hypothetical protein